MNRRQAQELDLRLSHSSSVADRVMSIPGLKPSAGQSFVYSILIYGRHKMISMLFLFGYLSLVLVGHHLGTAREIHLLS